MLAQGTMGKGGNGVHGQWHHRGKWGMEGMDNGAHRQCWHRGYGAHGQWENREQWHTGGMGHMGNYVPNYVPMCPIVHVPHYSCAPYPCTPLSPVTPLPMCPIPPVPHIPYTPLHPVHPLPMCPITPVPI